MDRHRIAEVRLAPVRSQESAEPAQTEREVTA
jgi:hypothetical protein